MKEKDECNIDDESHNKRIIKEEEYEISNLNKKIPQDTNPNIIQSQILDKPNLLNVNTEFDEIIYFSNYFSVFRKIEFKNPIVLLIPIHI